MGRSGALRLLTALCILLTSVVVLMQAVPSSAAPAANWTQYGHDAQRSSVDADQTPLKSISLDWSNSVDAAVFGQPLVWNGRVYVATENNSIYAFDGLTGKQDWVAHMATPASSVDVDGARCSNLGPTVGITGTPAIDPVSGRLYAVGEVHSSSLMSTLHYELWTLDANTGARVGTGRVIDPWFLGGTGNHTSTETRVEQQRGAVLLANNTIYVTFGGQVKQCGAYYGWVAGIPVNGGTETAFQIPALPVGGSIWSPGGPSVDPLTNDIWLASSEPSCGTTCQTTALDLTDSVLKFSPGLGLLDSFTPTNVGTLNDSDLDLGSFTPAHLGNDVVFAIGKAGTGYLLRASNLGHTFPGSIPPPKTDLFEKQVCDPSTIHPNTLAHTVAAWSPPNLYVPCQAGVRRVVVNTGASPSFSVAAQGPDNGHLTGSTMLAYGAVWNVNPIVDLHTFLTTSGFLYAMDPQTLQPIGGTPIELKSTSGAVLLPSHFPSPSAGLGHIYIASNGGINAYSMGLAVTTPPPSTPTNTQVPVANLPTATANPPNVGAASTPTPVSAGAGPSASTTNTPVPPTPATAPSTSGGGASSSGGVGGGGGGGGGGGAPAGGGGGSSASRSTSLNSASGAGAGGGAIAAAAAAPVAAPALQVAGVTAANPNAASPQARLSDGSVLASLSPGLDLLEPAETLARFDVNAEVVSVDPAAQPAPPEGFGLGGDAFSVSAVQKDTGDNANAFPAPLTLTYRPPATLLSQAGDLGHIRIVTLASGNWVAAPCASDADALTCSVAYPGTYAGVRIPDASAPMDGSLPNGWFYRQANGFGGAGPQGYSVVDDDQASFWTEFQRLGGVSSVGYPISQRFDYHGFTTQAFQKLVLQWRPELGQSVPVNVLDDLNQLGADAWLDGARQVPPAADTSADAGLTFDQVVARHTAILDAYPDLRGFYDTAPDALTRFGLPLSIKDYGAFVAVRLQRATLQLWRDPDGTQRVVVGNAADLAKEAGLWPISAVAATVTSGGAPAAGQ